MLSNADIISHVQMAFDGTKSNYLSDASYLEHFLIPSLGLNNENLSEQPPELSSYMGGGLGLRIWQYPIQFAKYAALLSRYAQNICSYIEIGCRHGGTYIFHVELLRHLNKSSFQRAVAVDIIEESPFLLQYNMVTSISSFMRENSGTDEFKAFISSSHFDVAFIDGDHSYLGVKNDAEITLDKTNIQVFHDISSDVCPGVPQYWQEHKDTYSSTHDFYEFTDQYESVNGTFLGIGVAVRKDWIYA
jgi:hypothetical protein